MTYPCVEISKEILARRKSMHQLRIESMMKQIRALAPDMPDLPTTPVLPPASMILNRARLVFEETMELLEALGVGIHVKNAYGSLHTYLTKDDFKLTIDKPPDITDIPHIAKELADVSVVTIGTFSEFGICDTPILEEVDIANLRKFSDGCYIDENKKLRKPPDFKDADLSATLKDQGLNLECGITPQKEVSDEESKDNFSVSGCTN